jgi:formylglycine-generating enzyme required for sulfatase activity
MRRPAFVVVLTGCGASTSAASVPPYQPLAVAPLPRSEVPRAEELAASSAPAEPTPPAIAGNGCPEDMVAVAGFCMDRYEAPNEKGELPFALQTAYDGEAWCVERHKRLCSETEWVRACEGPQRRRYPYGDEYREDVCNDDRTWVVVRWKVLAKWPGDAALEEAARLFQGDMSGARSECVSAEGVYDLTGNVAEWVRRSGPSPRTGYDHVLKGCFWAGCFKDPRPSCTFTNGVHPGSFRTYEAGFRCCTDRATRVTSPL